MPSLADYGPTGPPLEDLRAELVSQCRFVAWIGFTKSGAKRGEYGFKPIVGQNLYVRAPVSRSGRPRQGWSIRRHGDSEPIFAATMQEVVQEVCRLATPDWA